MCNVHAMLALVFVDVDHSDHEVKKKKHKKKSKKRHHHTVSLDQNFLLCRHMTMVITACIQCSVVYTLLAKLIGYMIN